MDFNDKACDKFPLLHATKAVFHRAILDEAQCIKNRNAKTAKACHSLRASYKWCLTSDGNRYSPLRSSGWHYERLGPFREHCRSMRLTCKTLSTLSIMSASLFYDFTVFATRRSISILQLLAEHPALRNYVRLLVFCRPVFVSWLADEDEYRVAVSEQRRKRDTTYTRDELAIGYIAYNDALREQEDILNDREYLGRCGLCISSFPRLFSLFVSDSVPDSLNCDIRRGANLPPLLRKKHPEILLDGISDYLEKEDDVIQSANCHTTFVLQALVAANVKIEEFVIYNDWGPTWEFLWGSVSATPDVLDISKLTRVDLSLRDGSMVPEGADWSLALCPLFEYSCGLTEIYLRFNPRHNTHPTISQFWDLNFPSLNALSIEQWKLSRTTFCSLLQRQSSLRELTLQHVREIDGQWYSIFESIREHPSLDDLEIGHLEAYRLDCPVITFNQPELADEVTLELYDYLHGEGEWTAALSQLWESPP